MIDARLPLALEDGALELSQGASVAVINPPADARLDSLSEIKVEIVDGFFPSHEAWKARGYSTKVTLEQVYDAVIVCLPRSKSDARAMIADAAAASSGVVVVDGQKTDGVDSLLRDMRKRCDILGPISKAHGKIFWCVSPKPDAFDDWRAGPELTSGGFWTAPGVFSADAVDPASALLASVLPDELGAHVGDLGAGWGYLSAHVLTRQSVEAAYLVEANHMALECAKRNVTDPRAVFHWADATTWSPPQKLDSLVMNPPFHRVRSAEPELGQAFVRAAAGVLKPQGELWMVANRHLPYEETLRQHFAKVLDLGGDNRFKLFQAARPKRSGRSL